MSHTVIILAAVAILAISGLALTASHPQGAALVRPMIGDECQRMQCPDGLAPAKIKQYDRYVYCGCGTYSRGEPSETEFEYDLSRAHWSTVSP